MVGGGIPPDHALVELRLTFREGGGFDFHTTFERIKERLYQAYTVAREHQQSGTGDVDFMNVHLEQLPAYEPAREVERHEEERAILSPIPVRPGQRDSGVASARSQGSTTSSGFAAPDEPPPGYEETQAQAVGDELEQRLMEQAARQ